MRNIVCRYCGNIVCRNKKVDGTFPTTSFAVKRQHRSANGGPRFAVSEYTMFTFSNDYFNIEDTLDCGQVFRFRKEGEGFLTFALDHCAYVVEKGDLVTVDGDDDSFWHAYFDLDADYASIVKSVISCQNPTVVKACSAHKGIRILRQSPYEALISFIISQNNNIPRIKSIIEKLCSSFGEKRTFKGVTYHAFPTVTALSFAAEETFASLGLGYRAAYLCGVSKSLAQGTLDLSALSALSTDKLREELLKIKGVGNKVADCALLFGFNKTDSFPVDTWIEKLYREDFKGTLTDRKKISEYFVSLFKENSGLVQQYLFHAKRKNDL